jgi:hypothetical protein
VGRLSRRRAARRSAREDSEPRTYSIWILVAVFTALAVGGLIVLIFVEAEPELEQLQVPQTLPDEPTTTTTTTTVDGDAATPPIDAVAPTLPDGSPAPDGVVEVVVTNGTTSLTFAPPEGVTPPAGGVGAAWSRIVPAASATPAGGGSELIVRVECSASAGEFLERVTITETAADVAVAAVVMVPPDGPPCPAEGGSTAVTVPIASPLGDRTVTVVPPGSEVPEPPVG